jgi:D-lactate dehydrogenase (cytochrome)
MSVQRSLQPSARNSAGLAHALPLLRGRFGDRFADSEAVRRQHAQQTTWLAVEPPDAVVFPLAVEDVVAVVEICRDHAVPIIPFGTGTSLEGHVNAPYGGVSVDFSRMNHVLAVHAGDLDCVVEPGVTRKQLNDYLRGDGLFFPIDPGADASLGGMAATRASGTNAVRYGTMRDAVVNLTAVMADGSVVKTGGRAKKSAAGYDLARLLVGSEGTLGIITELTLRLHGIPQAIAGGVVPFATVEGACNATMLTIQSGIPIARIELLDANQVGAANTYSKLALKETPTLFVEFHGSEASVREQSEAFGEIAREFGGGEFVWAHAPVAGAARRLLGGADPAARGAGGGDRRLRAHLAAGRMRHRDRRRRRGNRSRRADRRPRRRRQFPPDHSHRSRRCGRARPCRGAGRPP